MKRNLTVALISLLSAIPSSGQEQTLDFGEGWEMSGQDTLVAPYLDETGLRMRTGQAYRRDVRLEDGTIDVDVATTGLRSFVYVQFRMQSEGEHEEVYLRPHKSSLPDAIQYAPVFHGESHWQLYHGETGTAPADLPRNEWTHIRIVMSGQRAAIFVGDVPKPQLVVPLVRAAAPGYIGLRSFVPEGAGPAGQTTSFANLVVRPGEIDFDFSDTTVEPRAPEGLISEWLLSEPYVAPDGPVRELPSLVSRKWRKIQTDPSGLAVFFQHFARPEPRKRATVLAKITLTAARAERAPLHLGYSDEVTVFLNGEPLLSADDSYSYDRPRREGLIGLDQATVYLPLRAGENELVLAVTDVFGGWGVMGRVDTTGVTASAK
ncbi:MAG: hypothetical protein ACRD21_16545 [Vicinamibacteria bacterium]